MADERTYIRVHDGMPDHPKIEPLSDKAFRLLITYWCRSSRHTTDGRISAATWKRKFPPKVRTELLDAGLIEELPDGDFQMHDYLEHQRSAAEIAEMKAAKSQGGGFGNHKRWHLDKGLIHPDCRFCVAPPIGHPIPPPITDPIGVQIANGSESDRIGIASSSTDTDTEQPPSGVGSGSSLDRHLPPQTREKPDEDEELDKITAKIEGRIVELLRETTGRTVDRAWASKIRRQLLDDRQVANPLAYVAAAIRGEPQRYLPTAAPMEAGNQVLAHLRTVDRDETTAATERGAPAVRDALAAAKARKASAP